MSNTDVSNSSSSTASLELGEHLRSATRNPQPGCPLPPFTPYFARVPWHTGPRAVFCHVFPKYGHYCGPNWSSGKSSGSLIWDKAPVDWLDYCCYCHDVGYDSYDQLDLYRADLAMLKCLESMPKSDWSDPNGNGFIAGLYRNACIAGLRSFLLPYRRMLLGNGKNEKQQ